MKKLSTFLLALVAGVGTIYASDTSVGGIWYNFDDENLTAEVTYHGDKYYSYLEYSGLMIIPSSVTYNNKTYTVTGIGDYAFYQCSGLTSVTIPNSVTGIGDWAFHGCSGLTSVTIPNSVTSIGSGAFFNVPNIVYNGTATGSPWGAKSVNGYVDGYFVYSDESKTTLVVCFTSAQGEIIIPNSVKSIGSSAFEDCSGLTSVTIPNSVTSIGDYAFFHCSGLTSVTIPNSVTSIRDGAFSDCTGLTSITNYATTPQSIKSNVFDYVNKSTCVLYVAKESASLYQAANVWKEFTNIVGLDDYTINYVDKDSQALYNHVVTLYVPVAPTITGFTFLRWETVAADIANGITIQAVYQSTGPTSAPEVYTNPANPAQKLIKNGNVYILTDDKTYTITGQQVK